jgi:hypothetical protein
LLSLWAIDRKKNSRTGQKSEKEFLNIKKPNKKSKDKMNNKIMAKDMMVVKDCFKGIIRNR